MGELSKQEIDNSACIHRLLALEGAIWGVKRPCFQISAEQN